jgi:enolase-phosphatase E1
VLGPAVHPATNRREVARVSLAEWDQVCVLLLDIEGTTTPIDFVYKTLFPYSTRNVEPLLREHLAEPEVGALVRELKAQHEQDRATGFEPPAWLSESDEARLRSIVAYVRWLIARDSKNTALKSLQGKIWKRGFENGELHGEVYPDVPGAFDRWRQQQREICIYSSGSVLAQQQLFRTVISGDLTRHIAGFFDTQTGIKTAPESYDKIAASLDRASREFLFISDAPKEVEAARIAGMHGALCDRSAPPSAQRTASETIHTFDEIFPR